MVMVVLAGCAERVGRGVGGGEFDVEALVLLGVIVPVYGNGEIDAGLAGGQGQGGRHDCVAGRVGGGGDVYRARPRPAPG